MRRGLALALAALVAAAPTWAAAPTPKDAIVKLVGEVNADNASDFLSRLADETGHVVGLSIAIAASRDPDFSARGYLTQASGGTLIVSSTPPDDADDGFELAAPKGVVGWSRGRYTIDGFYKVEAGATHQGVASMILKRATMPSPKVQVVEHGFR